MPLRPLNCEQVLMLPPILGELVPTMTLLDSWLSLSMLLTERIGWN